MTRHICIYCRTVIINQSTKYADLCINCYRLIKKAEKEERLIYLSDG